MADTPKRPVVIRFVFGKGNVKRRKESEDTARAVVEQVAVQYATSTWNSIKTDLKVRIRSDVRAELLWMQNQFRQQVIGVPGSQRGIVGSIQSRAVGGDRPVSSNSGLPRWAPRGARYLEEKRAFTGNDNWFDNTGWEGGGGGELARFFGNTRSPAGDETLSSGGVLETIFGEISVDVIRNNRGWGVNAGTIVIDKDMQSQTQLATIYVRALKNITPGMLRIGDTPNRELLNQISQSGYRDIALRLRGGRGRYRPALEPYLKFFLEQSVPQAISRRLAKANLTSSLFPKRK